jgi:hypothetical protein
MRQIVLAVDIPRPVDVVTNVLSKPAGWAWEKVAQGVTGWVLGGVGFFVDGTVDFLETSARPNVEAAWFAGANSPYATVRNIAAVLLLAFVFLGLIQGLLAGDPVAMIRRVAADLPTAVLGMVGTTVVAAKLLELTDALSSAVLAHSGNQSVHFLSGFGVTVTGATQGFAAVVVGLVAVIAGMFVWIELMVRSVLVYILIALSPMSFAAMVWPSARGVLRRTLELLLAVILSKLVVCITISVGVAALAGAGDSGGGNAADATAPASSMGTLFVGTAVLVIAAFAPFLVLKLIPWTEAALVAYGVSRSPVRAANSTVGTVNSASSIARLAGGSHRSAPALPAGGGGYGWVVGAPVQGTGSGGGAAGAAAGPAGVAAAAGASVASAGVKGTVSSVEGSTEALANGATEVDPKGRRDGGPPPRRALPPASRDLDAPGADEDDE